MSQSHIGIDCVDRLQYDFFFGTIPPRFTSNHFKLYFALGSLNKELDLNGTKSSI